MGGLFDGRLSGADDSSLPPMLHLNNARRPDSPLRLLGFRTVGSKGVVGSGSDPGLISGRPVYLYVHALKGSSSRPPVKREYAFSTRCYDFLVQPKLMTVGDADAQPNSKKRKTQIGRAHV